MLYNAYLDAEIGVDTAENEPPRSLGKNSIHYSLHSLKVARGGCFATPDLVLRGEYRSFYSPTDRREVAIGFRTCALD